MQHARERKVATKRVTKQKTRKTATRASRAKSIEFKCITFHQGQTQLILFVANAKALWEIVDVDRRAENKDEGYQRALSGARVAKVANFIDGGNVIPNSVLISFDEGKLSVTLHPSATIPSVSRGTSLFGACQALRLRGGHDTHR